MVIRSQTNLKTNGDTVIHNVISSPCVRQRLDAKGRRTSIPPDSTEPCETAHRHHTKRRAAVRPSKGKVLHAIGNATQQRPTPGRQRDFNIESYMRTSTAKPKDEKLQNPRQLRTPSSRGTAWRRESDTGNQLDHQDSPHRRFSKGVGSHIPPEHGQRA